MTKRVNPRKNVQSQPAPGQATALLFWACVAMLVLVPLVFSTSVYRIYVLPKFAVLTVGSAGILVLTMLACIGHSYQDLIKPLKSRHVLLVSLYVLAMAVATVFGVSPLASLLGSNPVQMGLTTRLCFFVVFVGLIVSIGGNEERYSTALWAMSLTGLAAAAYACLQFFGSDPFLKSSSYTFDSPGGSVVRVPGPLGHSNYLGNFLLYTAPLSAGLALASRGRARRIAMAGAALSVAAIAFSGTRGAWFGAGVGAVVFAFLEIGPTRRTLAENRRGLIIGTSVAAVVVLIAAATIIRSPASRNITNRARSFVAEGFTGAGRTLLWRDSLTMVPQFIFTGCGPEGFGKAFLAYKSEALARYSPDINNESSHNSYIDAAISFGLPGAVLYIATIASAFLLLVKSRRRILEQPQRLVQTGLLSSLAAVVVHNFFIYDQIPTGLYFFAFMAIAAIVPNQTKSNAEAPHTVARKRYVSLVAVAGFLLLAFASWYAVALLKSDIAVKQAFASANALDFEGLIENGYRAARAPDPTGAYHFLFARALTLYVDLSKRQDSIGSDAGSFRARAIELADKHAEVALAHTLSPESNYVLLAYLSLAGGDTQRLRQSAEKAVRWDPFFFNSRWLLAEALLADGDREGAVREAQFALDLRPGSREARSVLRRARGEVVFSSLKSKLLVDRARKRAKRGNVARAIQLLTRAVRRSDRGCPTCHRELALLYERTNRSGDAIAEWEAFSREDPKSAAEQNVPSRIESLKRK